jgi:cell wall-associated NlpC family hydrolase
MVLTLSKKEIPISQKPKKVSKKSRRLASAHKKGGKKASRSTKRGKKHIASAKKRKKRSGRKSVRNGHRINSAIAALKGSRGSSYSNASSKVIRTAKRYLGRRYVWGATGPSHFDCSGFTQYVMKKSKGIKIPRVSRMQAYYGKYVSRKNLKPGDLIFFDTSRRRRGYVNHVGIYIGNDKFIHASSARHRVVITSLNRPFYRARFKWGRRID